MRISFGALSPPLKEQLKSLAPDKFNFDHFQDSADCITKLWVRGFITVAEAERARKRLANTINAKIHADWSNAE